MNDLIEILVCPDSLIETDKAWNILTYKNESFDSWYKGFWYPKNICHYADGKIKVPRWFYDRIFGHLTIKPETII